MAATDWPPQNWTFGTGPFTRPAGMGWQCPVCKRVYSPSMVMCSYCPAGPLALTDHAGTVDFIARGSLGTPCPKPREGGMCGCDEDDFNEAQRDCYQGRCGC